ncbi:MULTISPECIES: hypothetical protein [unclassified Pseudomonas]|uniref:hypothetical protein n=1 Tax=unclassified Pseudomonas TaxID=196821 RepID=UPI0038066F36
MKQLKLSKECFESVTEEVREDVRRRFIAANIISADTEIVPSPDVETPASASIMGFPGNFLEAIGKAAGIDKCDVAGEAAYALCMVATSGTGGLYCTGIGAAAKLACQNSD